MKIIKSKEKGITLVALIITIIILVILAAVSISAIVKPNNLLEHAMTAAQKHGEQAAREKLEISLVYIKSYQSTDSENYNEYEYLDNKLIEYGIKPTIPLGNVVEVDGWSFQIDRDKLIIDSNLGNGTQSDKIQIALKSEISNDYSSSNLFAEISADINLKEIKINGEIVNLPEPIEGKYVISYSVSENGDYIIEATDNNGNYKTANIKVVELTEDMEIWNKDDLELFRRKVAEGRTFANRKVSVMADIEVNGTEENQWVPIERFAGIFEGNNNSIKKIYINSSNNYVGLFSTIIEEGTIRNIKLEDANITGNNYTGGIVGYVQSAGVINNCSITGTVAGNSCTGGIVGSANDSNSNIENCKVYANVKGSNCVGGIVGRSERTVVNCGMYGDTTATASLECLTGGVVGELVSHYIYGCVNKGNVNANDYLGGIVGEVRSGSYVSYCYNTGNVTGGLNSRGSSVAGGIVGETYGDINYCFALGTITGNGEYVGGIIGAASGYINCVYLKGCADVYRNGVFVGVHAWDNNRSGGLYGSLERISCSTHYYVQGEHTVGDAFSWYTKEFVENDKTPGVPKLKWED